MRCTHNDRCPDLEPCKNEGVGEDGYCIEHGCCLCGGVMLADTEDWRVYLCFECFTDARFQLEGDVNNVVERLLDAAYEAGRRSVIGHCDDIEDEERPT